MKPFCFPITLAQRADGYLHNRYFVVILINLDAPTCPFELFDHVQFTMDLVTTQLLKFVNAWDTPRGLPTMLVCGPFEKGSGTL